VLSNDAKKEPAKSPPNFQMKPSPVKGEIKTRFSDPPAPPPQQPLPEKPDGPSHQPLFRRSDTEKPKITGSPVRSDSSSQLNSLAEALNNARKEIESQSMRLKDLEMLLAQERLARENAEDRVQRLEAETLKDAGDAIRGSNEGLESVPPFALGDVETTNDEGMENSAEDPDAEFMDAATDRLQQRLEKMVYEMDEMKVQMEQYRQRAEAAEMNSARDRQTLAEMVEKIRRDEAERMSRAVSRSPSRNRGKSNDTESLSEVVKQNGHVDNRSHGREVETARAVLRKAGVQNGRPVTPEQAEQLEKAFSQALASKFPPAAHQDALMQGGPVVSMLGIVIVGVGLMAWLNSWPRVER
jgi:hypothetical protein